MANHSFVYHINITTIAHLKYFGNSIETTIQYFGVNALAYEKSELISKMTDKVGSFADDPAQRHYLTARLKKMSIH